VIKRITFDTPVGDNPDARRVVVCTVLPEFTPHAPYRILTIEWFADDGRPDPAGGVLAEEVVVRGVDWLAGRWRDGRSRLKHVALAERADGLTAAEFALRWREHAGRYRRPGESVATEIPELARGCAYVQNHPLPGVEQRYDAVTEVWFDDLAGLEARIAHFGTAAPADGLFGTSTFLAVREDVVR
jgi:hypothetical protein